MIKITDKTSCCGCFACMNACPKHCITMVDDSEGFCYPEVNGCACIDCGLCEKVCPIINVKPEESKPQRAFIAQHKNEKILQESTSGGAFTAIASWIIRQGGVVFGAAFDKNFEVGHQYVDKIENLSIFRNSKYVQSYIGFAYEDVLNFLKKGRIVCFSGTPCQLEGLLQFLHRSYENLITVDVMCHSVTSPKLFRSYVNFKKNELNVEPDNIMFRDKNPYGYKYSQMSFYSGGKQIYNEGIDTDVYLRSFFTDANVRPSCYDCKFKKRYHLTDFTLWDCFDVYRFSKEMDNDKGASRVLAHTDRAVEILRSLDDIKLIEINSDKAIAGVDEMFSSVKINPVRNVMFSDFYREKQGKLWYKYYPSTFRTKSEKIIRIILAKTGIYSTLKRIAKVFVKNLKRS